MRDMLIVYAKVADKKVLSHIQNYCLSKERFSQKNHSKNLLVSFLLRHQHLLHENMYHYLHDMEAIDLWTEKGQTCHELVSDRFCSDVFCSPLFKNHRCSQTYKASVMSTVLLLCLASLLCRCTISHRPSLFWCNWNLCRRIPLRQT